LSAVKVCIDSTQRLRRVFSSISNTKTKESFEEEVKTAHEWAMKRKKWSRPIWRLLPHEERKSSLSQEE
jgi:hypothetical protein